MIYDATARELASDEALAAFVESFEECAIPAAEWTHAAHVAMAGGYLLERPLEGAIAAARAGIQRYAKARGVDPSRYHETLTLFWVYVCHAFLQERGIPGAEGVRALVGEYGRHSGLFRDYYSYDVAKSDSARTAWEAPDCKALPAAWRRNDLLVSTNPLLLHLDTVHGFLQSTYWAEGIPKEIVARSLRNSVVFGVYEGAAQIALARVITDLTTFGYLADVYVREDRRGRGVSKWLMECVMAHPSLMGFRRWMLVTRDAQGLYEKYGFRVVEYPGRWMEIARPGLYKNQITGVID
ncbi:MAG: GNAT family N-acetyltransferase [Bryobacterales bacterium]|nr:GNAT family N-acetyltransferase [Bryobacterales bacterium]